MPEKFHIEKKNDIKIQADEKHFWWLGLDLCSVYAVSAFHFRPSENLPDFVTITIDQESDSVNPLLLTFQVLTVHNVSFVWILSGLEWILNLSFAY